MRAQSIASRSNSTSKLPTTQTSYSGNAKSRRARERNNATPQTEKTMGQRWNMLAPITNISKLSAYHYFRTLVHCVSAGVAAYKVIQTESDSQIKNATQSNIKFSLLGLYAITATAEAGIAVLNAYIAWKIFSLDQ